MLKGLCASMMDTIGEVQSCELVGARPCRSLPSLCLWHPQETATVGAEVEVIRGTGDALDHLTGTVHDVPAASPTVVVVALDLVEGLTVDRGVVILGVVLQGVILVALIPMRKPRL